MNGKRLLKVLSLSALAAISAMAINASAAQAEWELRRNGVSVPSLELTGTVDRGTMLVPGLLRIECASGNASATLEKLGLGVLSGEGEVTFTGCALADSTGKLNANCKVMSPGAPDGTIVASGEGTAQMVGTKYFALLEDVEFAFVEILGALCPLEGEDAEVSGSAFLTVDNAEEDNKLHQVLIDEDELFYGINEAFLDDNKGTGNEGQDEPLAGTALQGSATEVSGATWAIRLTGL